MTQEEDERRLRLLPVGLLAFYFCIAAFIKGLPSGDDSWYLDSTLFFRPGNFLHLQDWSPLYTLWFKALTLLSPNPVTCFFLSWGLLVSLLVIIPTWYRIRSAWIYAIVLLGFPFFTIDPYISLFAAAILLCGTCLALRHTDSLSDTTALFCVFAFITSFARPEFDYGVYLGAAVTVSVLVLKQVVALRRRPTPQPLGRSIAIGCAVILMAGGLFAITKHSRSSRSGVAFAQHFNRRAFEHGLLPGIAFWTSDYAQRQFGIDLRANSNTTTAKVSDFFHANPRLFLGHMWANLVDPRALAIIFPLAFFVLWPWVRQDARHLRNASIFVLLVGLPCIASTLVIYPRSHYAMVLIPSLTIYALQLFNAANWLPRRPMTLLFTSCALIFLTELGLPQLAIYPNTAQQTYLLQVVCVRQIDQSAPAAPPVFTSVGIPDIYLNHRRKVVDPEALPHWADFEAWTKQEHPVWIAFDDTLPSRYGVSQNEIEDTLRYTLNYSAHRCPYAAEMTVYTPNIPAAPSSP